MTVRNWLWMACLMLLSGAVHAQVINTEGKRIYGDKDGWYGTADLGFGLTKNIRTILAANSRISAQYHKNHHTLLLLNDLNLLKVDSNAVQNSGFQHVRYSYRVRNFLIPEAFVQAQYNQVWKLDFRFLAGAGPRFQILRNDSNRVFMGLIAMYEFEKVNHGAAYSRDLRMSAYLSLAFGINKPLTFESITYFQPRPFRPRDFRLSSESSLRAAITKHLGFKTSFGLMYDAFPPDAATRLFYTFQNGFSWKF